MYLGLGLLYELDRLYELVTYITSGANEIIFW